VLIMTAHGRGIHEVPGVQAAASRLSWSLDDQRIAFSDWQTEGISIAKVDGGGLRHLTGSNGSKLVDKDPAWSPDGKTIAFSRFEGGLARGLFVVAVDNVGLRRLVVPPSGSGPLQDSLESPAWSPDGGKIAYFDRPAFSGNGGGHIKICDSNGHGQSTLVDVGVHDPFPTWSPDGQSVVYFDERGGWFGLWVVAATGGRPRHLARAMAEASWG
jgi:Tol biopolymer transport system component